MHAVWAQTWDNVEKLPMLKWIEVQIHISHVSSRTLASLSIIRKIQYYVLHYQAKEVVEK